MYDNGFIKIYRKVMNDPVITKDNDYFRVWFYLLINANYKEKSILMNGQEVVIESGSFLTGRKKIANECNCSESKVERILNLFEKNGKIEQQKNNKNRLISIKKWGEYQESEQQVNNNWTTSEQQMNNNWTTSEQQVNTTKEYKEYKKERNKERKNNNNNSSNHEIYTRVYKLFEENISLLTPMIKEELDKYINEVDEELIQYAIRQANINNVRKMSYISSILDNLKQQGIKTYADLTVKLKEKIKEVEVFDYDWLDEDENT